MTPRPLLIEDLPALRDKLQDALPSTALGTMWTHFKILAEHQAEAHPVYPALVALVDPENHGAAMQFRKLLENEMRKMPGYARMGGFQDHTWCWAMQTVRWVIAYDWVADHPVFADFDHAMFADMMLDINNNIVLPVANSRPPQCDNQIGSMLLSSGLVGYLWSVKRGRDERARRMYANAMRRGPEIAAMSEPGFVGEGSQYMIGVNAVVMGLWAAWFEWLDKDYDRDRWLSCLESSRWCISPGGLTLPWDAGGNVRAFNLSGLVQLAKMTGDPTPINTIMALNMWHGIDHGAWGDDLRAWALIWWPEGDESFNKYDDLADPIGGTRQQAFEGWMHPVVGAGLDENGIRVAQLWDMCGGGQIGGVGRPNCDPNTLIIDANGVPLVLDGSPGPDSDSFVDDPEVVLTQEERDALQRELHLFNSVHGGNVDLRGRVAMFAHGCVGGSNGLVFNGETWYYPRKDVAGRGTMYAGRGGPLPAVSADVTEHYTPHYNVKKVERTTFLLDESRLALVLDEVDTADKLDIRWQIHARRPAAGHSVETIENGLRIPTAEGPALRVITTPDRPLTWEDVPGYPKVPDNGSTRIMWETTVEPGRHVFATLLAIDEDKIQPRAESAWGALEYADDGDMIPTVWEGGFLDTLPSDPTTAPDVGDPVTRGDLNDVLLALAAAPPKTWRWLRCRTSAQGDYLRLPVLNEFAGVWWNGACVQPFDEEINAKSWGATLPLKLDADSSHEEQELLIISPSHHGRIQCDTGWWHTRRAPNEVGLTRGDGPQSLCQVMWGTEHGPIKLSVSPGEGAESARWTLDLVPPNQAPGARTTMYLDARQVETDDVDVMVRDNAHIGVLARDGEDPPVVITSHATLPEFRPARRANPLTADEARGDGEPLAHPDSAGYKAARCLVATDPDRLIAALDDHDWRVKRAAIIRLGEIDAQSAVPTLRRMLSDELERTDIYEKLPNPDPADPAEGYAAMGSDPTTNRFRLTTALLEALHRLGDAESADLARRALDRPDHFYPVYVQALRLLTDLGAPTSGDRALFEHWAIYPEKNTQMTARKGLGLEP